VSPQRVLITGSSGFYGRAVVGAIRKHWPSARVFGLDVVSAKTNHPDEFELCDITSPKLRQYVLDFLPDTLIHLAFVVNPLRDEEKMHAVNVGGTRNVLAAAADAQPARLLISSSATAYGAWPDNPIPMTENQPLRARTEYRYADDKFQVEGLLADFSQSHPALSVSWTRPCMIYGPGMSNFMTTLFTVPPVLTLPGGSNSPMQLVHLEDVAEATLAILNAEARGPFNLAPPDWFTIRDLAKLSGRFAVSVPFAACRAVTACWWALHLPIFRFPAPLWYFIRYPWVVAPERLMTEVGFQFRHSSADVIRQLLRDAGKLKHP
jgi:UDP-glucose 4-epimerase